MLFVFFQVNDKIQAVAFLTIDAIACIFGKYRAWETEVFDRSMV